jgi:hypothetical protein
LTGTATDAQDHRRLADVIVTATSPSLQGEQVVVTAGDGSFRIPELPAGVYALRFEHDGYRTAQRQGIWLNAEATLRINAELLPENIVAEEVMVSARPPVVDVGSSSVGSSFTGEMTQRVPVAPPSNRGSANRSFESVAEVAPGASAAGAAPGSRGVSPAPTTPREHGASAYGLSATSEPYMVDTRHQPVADSEPAPTLRAATVAKESGQRPYTGRFAVVMNAIARHDAARALDEARAWHAEDPTDVMALVAFGEALEATGDLATAARAYGSIIDLFPSRADLRRFAGERLERLNGAGEVLALDTFEKAEAQRPDHPSSHRLVAFARLRRGDFAGAFAAAFDGLHRSYPPGRFAGVERVLAEDLGLVAAAWIKAEPRRRAEILKRVQQAGGVVESGPSVRFVLNWETDANDVDFHIFDSSGNHAFYQAPRLATGGELYADVTTGYGPECFTIRGPPRGGPYRLEAHYYSRGPMGYGMGKLEIIEHDGRGGLRFEERPFVVMADRATVSLGTAL